MKKRRESKAGVSELSRKGTIFNNDFAVFV